MQQLERIANGVVEHRRVTVLLVFVLVVAVSGGIVFLEHESAMPAFTVGSAEEQALEDIEANFSTAQDDVTVAQIVVEDGNALSKGTLVSTLELQQEIRTNESIAPTLVDDRPTVGIANMVATAAIREQSAGPDGTESAAVPDPTLDEQIAALEAMDQREVEALLERLLGDAAGANADAFALLPSDYEPGSTEASASMVAVFQTDEIDAATGQAPPRIVDSQAAMQDIAAGIDGPDLQVIGNGVLTAEMDQANGETFLLLGPLALLFVLVTLSLAYRDVLDIALSLVGIVLVLLWTFGALGWIGIAFNPTLIAIPVLLIGLSIDFGIHVFMRYREAAADGDPIPTSMGAALSGVGVALVWVTVTTTIGFLSNLASPVPLIREIGLIAAIGIVGAFVVFGAFVPALKTILDERLEARGFDRRGTALGTGDSRIGRLLSGGAKAAGRAPVVVLVAVLLLTAGTTVVATDVSTSFESEDTLVEDAPGWSQSLPGPFATSEYTAKETLQVVDERFVHPDSQVEFLVEGSVTDPSFLAGVDDLERKAPEKDVVAVLANGEARTTSPVSVIDSVAARNESFNATVAATDTDGDGVPDRNVATVYDELFATAPDEAAQVLHQADGEYRAARVSVAVDRVASGEAVMAQSGDLAANLDGDGRQVVATGSPVVAQIVQDSLLESLLITLVVTLLVIGVLLGGVYRVAYGSATLGLVTLVPVLLTVSWVFATMVLLDIPLNLVTSIVASLAIGLGVDYSIHVSERFRTELAAGRSVEDAILTTIRGTGGALLGSATTTVLGFGVLAFALLPILQQFGTIMAVMIVYAFLAAIVVLPSLLVLWTRITGVADSDAAVADQASGDAGETVAGSD
ncbi:Patched family protein [Halobacteriales archaeon SW_10_66_29]|nr:MAG: Patched family protein [Halobacteriales archaeon SW_10_66_29]